MTTPSIAGNVPAAAGPGKAAAGLAQRIGLFAAIAVLLLVIALPSQPGLPPAGQVMLGILAFAVIVWMTEALDYAVSAVVIAALMVFLLAFVPDVAKPAAGGMGTSAALALALSGFSSSASWRSSSAPASPGPTGSSPAPRSPRCSRWRSIS